MPTSTATGATTSSTRHTIRLSNGDGTFGPDIRVVPDGQRAIAVLDFNGVGKDDLLMIASTQADNVYTTHAPFFFYRLWNFVDRSG